MELAKATYPTLVANGVERKRVHWKVSADLSLPLMSSERNLDSFEGYIVFSLLKEHRAPAILSWRKG
jgi:hypothetical protein